MVNVLQSTLSQGRTVIMYTGYSRNDKIVKKYNLTLRTHFVGAVG